jgi:hypothetical protein
MISSIITITIIITLSTIPTITSSLSLPSPHHSVTITTINNSMN